ncbi:MAG: adenylate/guanylate cyclase domain-containing protein [Geminicoccaceae bacterium]
MPECRSIDDVLAWLRADVVQFRDMADLLTGLAERLSKAGLPLEAMTMDIRTLHPLMAGAVFSWRRGSRAALETPRFHDPFDPEAISPPMPTLSEAPLTEPREGVSEVLPLAIGSSDGSQHGLTLVSWREGGFTDAEVAGLKDVAHALFAPLEVLVLRHMTRTLMTTYLGQRTADRVLHGAVRRGSCESVHAVLLYSDLRGFTAFSQGRSGEAITALLNSHFERLVAPIKAFGGEVLKFMGDGLLAIFPVDMAGSAGRACSQAVKSVRAARSGMASLNGERQGRGEMPLEFGVALHLGEVMYGNIGAPDRLDFTVIGPAVNLASRLEALCKPLDCPVLVSSAFEDACDEAMAPLGGHRLNDIADTIEVFTLAEFVAPEGS